MESVKVFHLNPQHLCPMVLLSSLGSYSRSIHILLWKAKQLHTYIIFWFIFHCIYTTGLPQNISFAWQIVFFCLCNNCISIGFYIKHFWEIFSYFTTVILSSSIYYSSFEVLLLKRNLSLIFLCIYHHTLLQWCTCRYGIFLLFIWRKNSLFQKIKIWIGKMDLFGLNLSFFIIHLVLIFGSNIDLLSRLSVRYPPHPHPLISTIGETQKRLSIYLYPLG